VTHEILADLRRLGQSYYFTEDTSDIEVFDSAAKMRAHMILNVSLANIHLYTVHYGKSCGTIEPHADTSR
jgi:hypothetical protein